MRTLALLLSFLLSVAAASAASDITGFVVDAGAKPVAGAHVYVYYAFPKSGTSAICPSCYRDCGKKVQVDDKGAFRLKDLDDTLRFELLAVAEGYEPAFVSKVEPAKSPVTVTLQPRSAADADRLVTGFVVDPDGKPVVGARVEPRGYHLGDGRIAWGTYPGVDKLSITDGKGAFSLRIPAVKGKLDVRVIGRNFAPMLERAISVGEPRTIRLTEGATISGYVKKGGKPVAGARVAFNQRSRASSHFLGTFDIGTNEHGLFVMTNLAPSETWVVHVPEGGVSGGVVAPKVVTVGEDKTSADAGTLELIRGRRIGGTIVVPQGVSIPAGTKISCFPTLGAMYETAVRPDGTFLFESVPPGEANVLARIPGLIMSPVESDEDRPHNGAFIPDEGDCTDLRLVYQRQPQRP